MILQFFNHDLTCLVRWKGPWYKLKHHSCWMLAWWNYSKVNMPRWLWCQLRKIFLVVGLNATCVGITSQWINELVQTSMPCHYQRRFLMPLDRSRFLIPWTYVLITINCHWRRVTKSRWHFGVLIIIGRIVYTNGNFCHLVQKVFLKNSKELWIECW